MKILAKDKADRKKSRYVYINSDPNPNDEFN